MRKFTQATIPLRKRERLEELANARRDSFAAGRAEGVTVGQMAARKELDAARQTAQIRLLEAGARMVDAQAHLMQYLTQRGHA